MEDSHRNVLLSSQPINLLTNHVKELRKLWLAEAKKNRQLSTAISKAESLLRRVLVTQQKSSGAYLTTLEVLRLFEKDESFDALPYEVTQYFDVFGAALQHMKLKSVREAFRRVVAKPIKFVKVEGLQLIVLKVKAFAFGKIKVWASCASEVEAVQTEFEAKQACCFMKAALTTAIRDRLYRAWSALQSSKHNSKANSLLHIRRLATVLKPLSTRVMTFAFLSLKFYEIPISESESTSSPYNARKDVISFLSSTNPSEKQSLFRTEKLGMLLGKSKVSEKVFIRDSLVSNPYATVNPKVINRNLINEFSISQLIRALRAAKLRTQVDAFGMLKIWNLQDEDAAYRLKDAGCFVLTSCLSSIVASQIRVACEAMKRAAMASKLRFTAALLIGRGLKAGLRRRIIETAGAFARIERSEEVPKSKYEIGRSSMRYLKLGRSHLPRMLQRLADLSHLHSLRIAHLALHHMFTVTKLPLTRSSTKSPRILMRKALAGLARVVERRELSYSWKVMQLASYRQLLAVSLINLFDMFHNTSHRKLLTAFQTWHKLTQFTRSHSPDDLCNFQRHTANLSPIEGYRHIIPLAPSVFTKKPQANISSSSFKESPSRGMQLLQGSIHDYIDNILTVGSQLEDSQFNYSNVFEDSRDLQASFSKQHFFHDLASARPATVSLSNFQLNSLGVKKIDVSKASHDYLMSHQPTNTAREVPVVRTKHSVRYSM